MSAFTCTTLPALTLRTHKRCNKEKGMVNLIAQSFADSATYSAVHQLIGDSQTAELVCLLGYYGLVSMTLNTFQVALPDGESVDW